MAAYWSDAWCSIRSATHQFIVAIAVALIALAAVYTSRHHEWLFCALLLIEVTTSASSIPNDVNSAARYGLEFLFCLPILPAFVRSGIWRRGSFRLFLIYLGWGLVIASYSLAPSYSVGHLINTFMVFATVVLCASEVKAKADLNRLIGRGLFGCIIIALLLGLSWVLMAPDVTWQSDDVVDQFGRVVWSGAGGMLRFQGFLSRPNEVGETMMTPVALCLIYWSPGISRTTALLSFIVVLSLT